VIDADVGFYLDPSRCIGCRACVHACSECESHKGISMIHLDFVDRAESTQTVPVVCMHCEDPACARACPADAIKKTADGVVQTALASRCIGCSNCVLACPFGVPQYLERQDLMMKCDLCYDRTASGHRPMCATVCPSGALAFGPREEIERLRRERPVNAFAFGALSVRTRVQLMAPEGAGPIEVDVAALCAEPAEEVAV
jgi:Fe-S-cluster-containing dehydrogenase component